MSPPLRRTRLLDRSGATRSARLHIVATEDSMGPPAWFRALELRGVVDAQRVKVLTLATPKDDPRSDPEAVVDRLLDYKKVHQLESFDELWALIDVDHHFKGSHQRNLASALQKATSIGATVLVSNPCFEVWLLLHRVDRPLTPLGNPEAVRQALIAQGLGKDAIAALDLSAETVRRACARARSGTMEGIVPEDPGTTLYRLVERLLPTSPG